MENFRSLFESCKNLKIGVIGDVMLDSYVWGDVDRISPEAPVPVIALKSKEYRIGGAGNVALNLSSLGCSAYVISVWGNDDEGIVLNNLLTEKKINTAYCCTSPERITTNKTRIISRNQHMLRLDAEMTTDLSARDIQALIENFKAFVNEVKPDVVILEDYNKGVLTQTVIQIVIALCKKSGIITAVDPKRKNFLEYRGVDIFKPNLKEVKEALNMLFSDIQLKVLEDIHLELHNLLHHSISFITLSEKGVFYEEGSESAIIPSHIRNIADVSGAGDTVIAVAAAVYAITRNARLMAEIANIAGGLVCEEVGTVAIDPHRLLAECAALIPHH